MSEFGPAYPKINSLWKRDPSNRNIIKPGEFASEVFEALYDAEWEWTEKIDGTNIRIYYDGYHVPTEAVIGGRTDNAQIPADLYEALRPLTDGIRFCEVFGTSQSVNVTLYGEGYGPKIQKNGGGYRSDPGFILFDVRIGNTWLKREAVADIAEKFGVPHVAVLDSCSLASAWMNMVGGEYKSTFPEHELEGIVGRPKTRFYTNTGHGFSPVLAKIKYSDIDNYNRYTKGHVLQA